MNITYKILISLLGFCSLRAGSSFDSFEQYQYFCPSVYPELYKFFNKHRCPRAMEQEIEYNVPKIIQNDVLKYGTLFVKRNFERIINAKRLENYIKLHGLQNVSVAKKYLDKSLRVVSRGIFSADSRDVEFTKNLTRQVFEDVAVDLIVGIQDDKVNSVASNKFAADLQDLVRDTYYTDLHPGNFIFDRKSKKLVIIDTETRSLQALEKKIGNLEIKKYDDPDINIEKVLKEYRKFIDHRIFYNYISRVSSSMFLG